VDDAELEDGGFRLHDDRDRGECHPIRMDLWLDLVDRRLFCHWWRKSVERRISAMGAMILLLVSVALLVWALERNERRNAAGRPFGSSGGVGSTGSFVGDHGGPWTHN